MPSAIRSNRMKTILDEGGAALGFGVLTYSPDVIEVAGRTGIDFIWLDLEHSGVSPSDSISLGNLVRAAENSQLAVVVRVPGTDRSLIGKVLDTGAHSILVPGISSANEVRDIVAASKYKVEGIASTRGSGVGRAGGFATPDAAFARDSDGQVMVGVMIESVEAVENLEKILSVKGLDYVFVGPVDLSVSLGYPFDSTNPKVREAIDRIRTGAIGKAIPVGIPTPDAASARKAIADGFRIVRIGVDLPMISKSLGTLVKEIRG